MTTPTAAATPEELAAKLRADQDAIDDLAQSLRGAGIKHIRKVLAAIREAQAAQIAELTAERDAILSSLSEEDAERLERDKISRDNLRILDYIADKIGLPHDVELDESNFCTWFAPLEARATQAEAALAASQERERVMREALEKAVSVFGLLHALLAAGRFDEYEGMASEAAAGEGACRAAIQPKEPSHDR